MGVPVEDGVCLQTQGLSVRFGGLRAVDGVDVTVREGDVLGLIGPNGSGKTTFLNLITGIYRPTAGRVIFRGDDIAGRPPHAIRARGIARTFQSNRLCWKLSLLDNLLLGLYSRQHTAWWDAVLRPSVARREIREGIEKACSLIGEFNPDLVRRCYDPVSSIPLIDRRRVEIARALISEPTMLLLDEPTAGLNPQETIELIDDIARVKESNQNISIIIIEHDMTVIARISHRVVVLNAGRKIAEGPFAEIARNEEVRKAYLGEEM